jgi:hypothetical protein
MNWGMRGEALGLKVETLPNDWRNAVEPATGDSASRKHAFGFQQLGRPAR